MIDWINQNSYVIAVIIILVTASLCVLKIRNPLVRTTILGSAILMLTIYPLALRTTSNQTDTLKLHDSYWPAGRPLLLVVYSNW